MYARLLLLLVGSIIPAIALATPLWAEEDASDPLVGAIDSFLAPEAEAADTTNEGFWVERDRVTLKLRMAERDTDDPVAASPVASSAAGIEDLGWQGSGSRAITMGSVPVVRFDPRGTRLHLEIEFGFTAPDPVEVWIRKVRLLVAKRQVVRKARPGARPPHPGGSLLDDTLGLGGWPGLSPNPFSVTPATGIGPLLLERNPWREHLGWIVALRPMTGPTHDSDVWIEYLGVAAWSAKGREAPAWPGASDAVLAAEPEAEGRVRVPSWIRLHPPPRAPAPRWARGDEAVLWLSDLGYRLPHLALRIAARDDEPPPDDLERVGGRLRPHDLEGTPEFALAIRYFLGAGANRGRSRLLLSIGWAPGAEAGGGRLLFGPDSGYAGADAEGAVVIRLAWRLDL